MFKNKAHIVNNVSFYILFYFILIANASPAPAPGVNPGNLSGKNAWLKFKLFSPFSNVVVAIIITLIPVRNPKVIKIF